MVSQGAKSERGRRGSRRGRRSRAEAGSTRGQPIPERKLGRVARTLKAVAHPHRLRILEVLEAGERNVGDIVEATGAKPAVTSQQLGLMRDRGILEARREGTHVFYRIANPHVLDVVRCIRRSCGADE